MQSAIIYTESREIIMEISDMQAEDRVFRIDDECYIIYLGSERDDLKPFLRIGTSERVTPDIIGGTYNIVITDSLTGDPSLEPLNMNRKDTKENRYVGDRKITASLLKFIHQLRIENGTVSKIEDIQKAHKKAEVIFFDDGNIHVLYDRDVLFDLRKRERDDLHFIHRSNMLKDIHSRNPLHYRPEELSRPGFTVIGGSAVLFDQGHATAIGIGTSFFKDFVNAGIDPDLIDTVVVDRIDGALFKLLKRKWSTRKDVRLLTADVALVRSAAALFIETRAGRLDADIVSFKPGERRTVAGYRLERTDRGITARHKSIPWPLVISAGSSRSEESFKLNPGRGTMTSPGRGGAGAVPVPEGVVHTFTHEMPENRELLGQYFEDLCNLLEDLLSPRESTAVRLIDQVLEDIESSGAVKIMLDRARKALKKVKLGDESQLYYLLNNVSGIISLLHREGEETSGYLPLQDAAFKKITALDRLNVHLPVTGDVFVTDDGATVLYRPVRGATSREAFALTRELVRDVEERTATFFADLDREHARLRAFMADLRGESGAGRKRALRRTAAATSAAARGIDVEGAAVPRMGQIALGKEREKGEAAEKQAASIEERQAYTTAPVQSVSSARGGGFSIRWIIPAAVVVIAALLLFLFPGFLRERVGIALRGGDGERLVLSGEEAAETRSAEGTDADAVSDSGEPVAGESESFEVDESLERRGIPQSALTDRRTVIYRGLVEITILDIYNMTNEIAVANGYRRLDTIGDVGRDPDWIYPGNLFELPDGTEYSVVKGDTMWYVAHRFIIKRLEEDWDQYTSIRREVEAGVQDAQRKEVLIRELKYLRERSYSENFNGEIDGHIGALENLS
jgi:hypothetical protein